MWCDVKLLDLILPVRCVVCGAGGEQLCPACRGALPRVDPPLCARCGAPTAWPVQRCRECAGRHRCKRPQAALLPGAHELPDRRVVRDGGTGRSECEAAACALTAPLDRPRGWSAAASAERRDEPREGAATGRTELLAAGPADDAAQGQDQV